MLRQARIDASGVLQHISTPGIERRAIFNNNTDRYDFIGQPSLETGSGRSGAEDISIPGRCFVVTLWVQFWSSFIMSKAFLDHLYRES